ncbi:hypothetical protein J4434_02885 [Candidatus Woesearchaeota archaeon]|nr:hypothetical protein [Candidatus Woesearchaeota archaeon]
MVMLFDLFNLSEDVYEVIFATKQQAIVGKLLLREMKKKNGVMNKAEMSEFATLLHDGEMITEIEAPPYLGKKVKLSYNKRQFYDRILTPMKSMGMIDYDLYKKVYRVSDNFNKVLTKIGIMWMQEYRRDLNKESKKLL